MIQTVLHFLARLAQRHPWLIVLLFFVTAGASVNHTVRHLGINNNTAELLSQDLPFQRVRIQLERAFPLDAATIIVVVESATPELTAMAADFVKKRLQTKTDAFESVYISGDDPFFRHQGLLYLDLAQLEALSAKLIDAQPFIGYLSRNYHVAGLTDIIIQALASRNNTSSMPLDPLLSAIDRSVTAAAAGQSHPLSWQTLLFEDGPGREQSRRLLVAKPQLDFKRLMPAQTAMDTLRQLEDEMEALFPGVSVSFTGEVALEHEEMETVNQDMTIAGMVSLLLVCTVLWLGLRSFRLLLATFTALLVGLALTAGFATVAVGHLNLISVAFAVLYIGLGVDFATHLCLRYQECRSQGMNTDQALFASMGTVGHSLCLCAVTTAIGFFAFIPTAFKGVSELGLISGAGMFIGLIVSLTLLPALLKLMPIRPRPPKHAGAWPAWFYAFPFRHARAIRAGALIAAILAGAAITQVTFDSASVNLRDPNTPSVIAFKKLLRSQTDSPYALSALAGSLAEADRLAEDFSRLPSVHEALTLSDLAPERQQAKLDLIDELNLFMAMPFEAFEQGPGPSDVRAALLDLNAALHKAIRDPAENVSRNLLVKLHRDINAFIEYADNRNHPGDAYAALEYALFRFLPDTMSMLGDALAASPFGLADLPTSIRQHWVGENGEHRVLIAPQRDMNDPAHLEAFVNEVLAVHPAVFGLPIGDVTSGQAVVDAFIQAFASALALIALLLWLMTRSFKSMLLVLAPLLLAALLTAACNVLLDNPFNFANIIVLPLLLGMGVDSGIHIMHRLRHQQAEAAAVLQSSSARGVLFSALTTLCSFSSLAFNNHVGTASMGLLLSIGIALTLLCSLLVLPALAARKQKQCRRLSKL